MGETLYSLRHFVVDLAAKRCGERLPQKIIPFALTNAH